MSEERVKILEMVADGTITAEEGGKLLEALNPPFPSNRIRLSRPGRRSRKGSFQGMFRSMGESMGELMKEIRAGSGREGFPEDAETLLNLDEELREGSGVFVKGALPSSAGSPEKIRVIRDEGGRLTARPVHQGAMRVVRAESGVHIYADGGLELSVPDSAACLNLVLKACDLEIQGVGCPVRARVTGADTRIVRPGAHFSVKTMGGGLELIVGSEWKGASKAKAMGGGVSVKLLKGFAGRINAATMGGSVEVRGARVLEDSSSPGSSRKTVLVGDESSSSILAVKTMGGTVTIEADRDV